MIQTPRQKIAFILKVAVAKGDVIGARITIKLR